MANVEPPHIIYHWKGDEICYMKNYILPIFMLIYANEADFGLKCQKLINFNLKLQNLTPSTGKELNWI